MHTFFIKKYLFLAIIGFSVCISAQINYKHYTSLDGLQHDVTYNMLQDSNGYIWIATDDGLSKFDGSHFKNYSLENGLTSNYVTDIEEIAKGKYAISTWGGGLHFLENDTIFKNKQFKDYNIKSYNIICSDDKIYTNSGHRLLTYNLKNTTYTSDFYNIDDNTFVKTANPLLKSPKVNPVLLNKQVFVYNLENTTHNLKGIHQLSENKLLSTFSFLSEVEISSALSISEKEYVFASKNKLYVTTKSNIKNQFKIDVIKPSERIVKLIKIPKKSNSFLVLIRNKKGEKNLVEFNTITKEIVFFDAILPFKSSVSDAIFDFEGNLWISTFGDGVYCYYYNNPKIISRLKENYITDMVKNNDKVFAQTSSELFVFDSDTISKSYPLKGFAKKLTNINGVVVSSILETKNEINTDFSIKNGRFYHKGIYGTIRQNDTIFFNEKPVLITNELFITSILEQKNNTLNVFTNKGKWNYNVALNTLRKDKVFSKKLPSEKFNAVLIKNNIYYLATDKGLIVRDKEGVKVFNTANGLKNERVNSIFIKENSIYLGTQEGLSVIKNNSVYNYSKSFGISSLSINKIIEKDGFLWLSGSNGIAIIKIDEIQKRIAPKLIINQSKNTFFYEAISYADKNAITIQYKINDNTWQNTPNSKGKLDFDTYMPNTYLVTFRTQNSSSDWLYSKPFQFKTTVLWYKRWWVLSLVFLVVFVLSILLIIRRLKAVARHNKILEEEIYKRTVLEDKLNEVRTNIARDFHDDLGNKLASISLLSEVLSEKVTSKETKIVKTIKADADYLYRGAKDFIFSLQEKSNFLDEVEMYLSDFAEDYLYQFGISFEVVSAKKPNTKLPYYWSKQIIYIFKEVFTNAVKHSKASTVKMIFSFTENQLNIEVIDNGVGFHIDKVRLNGIQNMKIRAQKIACTLYLNSSEKGTSIKFIGEIPR